VDYGKVLKIGFRGIINEVSRALESLDRTEPGYIKKEQFYNAVLISYNAAIRFAHRYAEEASRLAQQESNPTRKRELEQIAQNCTRVPEYGAT
ncbi:pyruvate formate lyase family protein, partial [Escherichia coli]